MTAVASYFATLGVRVDTGGLKQVQTYLDTIQRKVESFTKALSKSQDLSLKINNVSVNQAALRASIRAVAQGTRIRLNDVTLGSIKVNQASINRSVRSSLKTSLSSSNLTAAASTALKTTATIDTVKVNRTALRQAINTAFNGVSSNQTGGLRISRFTVSRPALLKAVNNALNTHGSNTGIRIGALLSQSSLSEMRRQIRDSINQLIVSPTINPRINAAQARAQRSGQSSGGVGDRITRTDPRKTHNPWHNPMMIGGGAGAFIRYGVFSLPFIGGAMGLNALNTFAHEVQSQRTSLDMVSSMSTIGRSGDDNREYLRGLAQTVGKTSMGMAPIYTQMLAASAGTELEPQMRDMFAGIMQYASVMGLGEQSIKRAMTGF